MESYLKKTIILVSLFFSALIGVGSSVPDISLQPPNSPIPPTFFGMHIHRAATTTPWPSIPFGAWRLWDAYMAWPNLEPERGKWNFAGLDKCVALAEEHHVEILLPLGLSPTWASARPEERSGYGPGNAAEPKNIEDWREYVRTVGTHYKGRVHYYEIWNEPNLKQFFTGTPEQLVRLTAEARKVLKEVSPSNAVISPSATGTAGVAWLDQFLAQGGGNYVDAIGFHFYVNPGPPEKIVPLIAQVKESMAKNGFSQRPLWDTETGWAIQDLHGGVKPAPGSGFNSLVLSEDQASAYIVRAYILAWASGVSRFYWYAWDNKVMGLADEDAVTPKPPAKAYGEVENWLVGARMISSGSDAEGTWICQVSRGRGYGGWIIWNPDLRTKFEIPRTWGVKNLRDLAGGSRSLQGVNRIEISFAPVILEKPAQ